MLTRIEIDGFKTFQDFALDLEPLVLVVGPNASGKSNLFDALELLARLAEHDVREAIEGLRGEALELFRIGANGEPGRRIRLAAELLLEPRVSDPWGAEIELSHTRVRYSITIERKRDLHGVERLRVVEENAEPILARDDVWRSGSAVGEAFREHYLRYARRSPWLSTSSDEERPSFQIHQDGRAGRKREAPAAEASVLSSITAADFPHLFALRVELRSWRFLQLNPASMRKPSPAVGGQEGLAVDGSNLATVLSRLLSETASADVPQGVLHEIAADLAAVIPGVVSLDVRGDREPQGGQANREYRVEIGFRDAPPLTSRVISDGTLRILALLTLLHDPKHRGLVCFEEPENGIHPARLRTLLDHLTELVTDPASPETGEPLSQLVMNSHSPVALASLRKRTGRAQVTFADLVSVVDPESGSVLQRTRMRPVAVPGDLIRDADRATVSDYEVERYLATAEPPG